MIIFSMSWATTLKSLKQQFHQKDKSQTPYILDEFNVYAYYPKILSAVNSVCTRVVNCLIEVINDPELKIPAYVIVILDKDVIEFFKHADFGISKLFEKALKWNHRNVTRIVHSKRQDMFDRKSGSIAEVTRFIWVKMVEHTIFFNKEQRNSLGLFWKFNRTLDEVIKDDKYSKSNQC